MVRCKKCGEETYAMRWPKCDGCGHMHKIIPMRKKIKVNLRNRKALE